VALNLCSFQKIWVVQRSSYYHRNRPSFN